MKWQSMPANILKSMSMTRDETKASHLTVQYNAKIMDSHLVELLEESEKEKRHCLDDDFKKLQTKLLTVMRSLRKVWYTVEKSLQEALKI